MIVQLYDCTVVRQYVVRKVDGLGFLNFNKAGVSYCVSNFVILRAQEELMPSSRGFASYYHRARVLTFALKRLRESGVG